MIVGFDDYKSNYKFNVSGVIHVGAHHGQEYSEYIENFGQINTYWFEPIPSVFEQLSSNLADKPKTFLYNLGLGESESKTQIFLDQGNDGQSSSILRPKLHIDQFPHIKFDESKKVDIQVKRLDDINTSDANMLVLDTQGYELKVLKGAKETLKKVDYIFTEFNTIEMYEDCPKLEDIDSFLQEYGFQRVETWYTDQNWGDAFYIKNKKQDKLKIIYITPHLSTGGMPEYLRKKVELLKEENDVWVLELTTEFAYRIIRDKIESLIGDRLIALNKNYDLMYQLIQEIQPDIIHFEELSDYHIPENILDKIYIPERNYKIFETFHDSSIESFEKKFVPDKLLVVSPWQQKMMMELGVPIEVINHEIESGDRDRSGLEKLGLNPNKRHIMQVGLFSRRKNQSETFEIARMMPEVQFHFLGGLTENYSDYWKPLIANKPDNCIIWNERSDVYSFYQCFDVVIFPSRGQYGDRETNPLVIRESIAWKIPLLVRDLPVYMGMYKESDKVRFMSDELQTNVEILHKILNTKSEKNKTEIMQIDPLFFRKKLFNITFDSNDNKIDFEYLEQLPIDVIVSVKDIDTEVPIYSFDAHFQGGTSIWCIPIPKNHYDFQNNPNFGGFLFDFYQMSDSKKIYTMSHRLKRTAFQKTKFRVESFDPLFVNYEQFFTDKIYEKFFNQIDDLSVVVDVGANVGLFTQYCLEKGAQRIIALEINEKAIDTFEKIHSDKNQVKLISEGLSSEEGEIEIFTDPENSLISSIFSTHTQGLREKKQVKVIGLSDLIQRESLEKINLIKIDVEGAEYDIFKGIENQDLCKINFILMEFHDNFGGVLREEILNKLDSAGFEYQIYQDDCIGEAYEYEERGTIFCKKSNLNND